MNLFLIYCFSLLVFFLLYFLFFFSLLFLFLHSCFFFCFSLLVFFLLYFLFFSSSFILASSHSVLSLAACRVLSASVLSGPKWTPVDLVRGRVLRGQRTAVPTRTHRKGARNRSAPKNSAAGVVVRVKKKETESTGGGQAWAPPCHPPIVGSVYRCLT